MVCSLVVFTSCGDVLNGTQARQAKQHNNSTHNIHAEASMNDSNLEQNISYWEYNAEYERQGQRETVWARDGHFVDQSWLLGDGEQDGEIAVTNDRPTLLYTCIRFPSGPEAGRSIAHENHPFVALVHLLAAAEPNSEVFLSAPFLSDFAVIDQLCHYAMPTASNLNIFIILGPAPWNIESLQNFVGKYENRRVAVARLRIKLYGSDLEFYHSKAVVTSAGAMVGSYNYTQASRLKHYEHAALFGPSIPQYQGLRTELSQFWNSLDVPEVSIPRRQEPQQQTQPNGKAVSNPYKKKKGEK